MRFVNSMYNPLKAAMAFGLIFLCLAGMSQVNSPFSRYGIGDLNNSRNVASKGMGGLATAYSDIQFVNFMNPASYSKISFVTFDVGMEGENRRLSNQGKTESFESANLFFNYVTMGLPLMKNKTKTKTLWGMAFGIRPISRIRYNIQDFGRIPGIDSSITEYRGNGGLYRGFVGTGFRLGGLSLGANFGFAFGQQEFNTFRSLPNDSVFYFIANINSKTSINKFAADAGMQYDLKLNKKNLLRIGATGFLGGDARAQRTSLEQTTFFSPTGEADSVDVVNRLAENGFYTLPSGYSVGLTFETENKLQVGVEYEKTNWSEFRNFGKTDNLGDLTTFRIGGQLMPNVNSRDYYKQVAYRIGYYTGKDYIRLENDQLPVWGISIGAGFPLKRYNAYSTQFSTINTSFEFGKRGNNNTLYSERYFRINIGFALSDIWFIKRQFD